MTVASTQNHIEYTGDGSTQTFSVPFYFILNSDISAIRCDTSGNFTELVNGTDFTVTGGGSDSGGVVTLSAIPPAGYTILIFRDPPETQETKYYENGKFPASSHEAALDKLTMLIQSMGYRFDSLSLTRPGFFSNYYDAKNRLISNLADPVSPTDAANLRTVEGRVMGYDQRLNDEIAARKEGDAELDEKIRQETSARQDADANIQQQLTGNVPLEASAFSPISWHKQTIDTSVTIPSGVNAWSFGPEMEISPGQSVTVGANSAWTIANGQVQN